MRIRKGRFEAFYFTVAICLMILPTIAWAENNTEVTKRVGHDIEYLASDELEGRGPSTKGLQIAAEYIRDEFKSLGLSSGSEDGSYMQPFEITIGTEMVKAKTWLVLRGPDGEELKLETGDDFQALAVGGDGNAKADVVFAGYGISARRENYDDYADFDVENKVVLIIRREPQQGDEDSVFDGKNVTRHSYITTKLKAAQDRKAAAILLVNDPFSTEQAEKDDLTTPDGFGTVGVGMPIAHMKQDVANKLLSNSPIKTSEGDELATIEAIEDTIDETLEPMSQAMEGWTAEFEFTFERVKAELVNVVGILEGEGPLANETVVIGAHYDHLGFGPYGSRRPNERAVHNGADDNATGTAAVMELARRFAGQESKPKRRMVFVGFSGEERGLIGSNFYVRNPLIPLEDTIAMINFDMIGNLKKDGLQLGGVRTGKEFPALVEKVVADAGMKVNTSIGMGGSDHAGFFRKGIPVMFFHTGLTDLYHTPEDDFETINVDGVVKTIGFAERVLQEVVSMPERPELVRGGGVNPRARGAMAYLGVVPDYSTEAADGLPLSEVNEDGPAAKGGLEAGDVITKIGDVPVADIQGLSSGLRKYKPGEKVDIIVTRGEEEKTFEITLGRAPRR
ncbi:MAG: M20/M25/M40 family metallo-hydrolase [Planctomycetota bacterium]